MKCMIYQVYLGAENNLYNFCTDSVKKYCAKHGIDHIVQKEPILKIQPDIKNMGRSMQSFQRLGYLPIYEKENAFSYLDQYDAIAIVDSDIFIRDNAPNIFEELTDYTFAGVVEREMPITHKYASKIKSYSHGQYGSLKDVNWKWNDRGAEFMNMGLMMFSSNLKQYLKGNSPKEFIMRPEFKGFVDGIGNWKWSTDQTLLNYWIKKENIKVKNLSWKWNALYSAVETNKLNEAHFIHFFLKDLLPEKGENIKSLVSELGI